MAGNNTFTDLDFNSIKTNLKQYLSSQDRFKDYNFEGSNMSVLLDLLSYNTFQNNFYTNMAFSEMFLDSAQLRESVVSHAKELNYLPKSRHSSQSQVTMTIDAFDNPPSVSIPRGTKFRAICGTKTFTFVTDKAYTVYPLGGIYAVSNLEVFEGKINKEYYTVTGNVNQEFIINSPNVDTNSIRVFVRGSADVDATRYEYKVAENIYGLADTENVFFIEPQADFNYKIEFGRNNFGNQPTAGQVVEIEYRVTVGEEANGATNIQIIESIQGYDGNVISSTPSEGGSERESVESVKFFAPKAAQIQDRAINENDYEILLKNRFSEISAVSVYGGEELTPPKYGRVVVSVDVKGTNALTPTNINRYLEYLDDVSPLSIEPVFVNPGFIYVNVDTTVYYNTRLTEKSASDIKDAALSAISNYSTNSLSDFKRTFRFSQLMRAIDNSDQYILSNDTKTRAVIALQPELNVSFTTELNFKNKLIIDHPLTAGEDISTHIPAIKSSPFTYEGESAFIQDNGLGVLQVLQSNSTDFVYLNQNIGSVDYNTGKVTIKDLLVEDYIGTEFKIYAELRQKDIVSPKDRIIKIRPQDVTIRVIGIRE